MTKDGKIQRIKELKEKATQLKMDVEFYNATQNALKLVLNGSYA